MIDRTEFEKVIDSLVLPETLTEEELVEKFRPLYNVISKILPKKLFRYRTCSLRNIEAFNSDDVYAVSTDMFNDPYDGLVMYNAEKLKHFFATMTIPEVFIEYQNMVKSGLVVPESAKPYLQYLPQGFIEGVKANVLSINPGTLLEENLKALYDGIVASIEKEFPHLAKLGKQSTTVACFSETISSVTMWSHYADYHKGFALEYDVRGCMSKPKNTTIFLPVVYNDKRFDATDFILWQFLKLLNINIPNPDMLSHMRCSIHKSKQWEYEQEWRMINTAGKIIDNASRITKVTLKPNAVYYGQSISSEDKAFLHEIAVKKGITEYEMYLDYTSDAYEMKYKKI